MGVRAPEHHSEVEEINAAADPDRGVKPGRNLKESCESQGDCKTPNEVCNHKAADHCNRVTCPAMNGRLRDEDEIRSGTDRREHVDDEEGQKKGQVGDTPIMAESRCPGCGLTMPKREVATYHGYYNASPECWLVYTEVLASEYSNAVVFGQVHQLTVDTYAVQHAGGPHPDKSVDVHLSGLYLVLEQKLRPTAVAPILQRLASRTDDWPHFISPTAPGAITVLDVALSKSTADHMEAVRRWATLVWAAWSAHHSDIGSFVSQHVT
jgi:hypothetical protein